MSDGTEMSDRPESPENLILTRKRGRKPFQFRIMQLTLFLLLYEILNKSKTYNIYIYIYI